MYGNFKIDSQMSIYFPLYFFWKILNVGVNSADQFSGTRELKQFNVIIFSRLKEK